MGSDLNSIPSTIKITPPTPAFKSFMDFTLKEMQDQVGFPESFFLASMESNLTKAVMKINEEKCKKAILDSVEQTANVPHSAPSMNNQSEFLMVGGPFHGIWRQMMNPNPYIKFAHPVKREAFDPSETPKFTLSCNESIYARTQYYFSGVRIDIYKHESYSNEQAEEYLYMLQANDSKFNNHVSMIKAMYLTSKSTPWQDLQAAQMVAFNEGEKIGAFVAGQMMKLEPGESFQQIEECVEFKPIPKPCKAVEIVKLTFDRKIAK